MSEETWGFEPKCYCVPFTIGNGVVWKDCGYREAQNWDLTPYQEVGLLKNESSEVPLKGLIWRIKETGMGYCYQQNHVDEEGTLIGLPSVFEGNQCYEGYMALEIGCLNNEDAFQIISSTNHHDCDASGANWP